MSLAVLVICCLMLASGHGAVLFKSGVHRDLCSWGPQYWCSSTKTADRCGKTEYCSSRVWPLEIIQDVQCQVTQQVVKETRRLMNSKSYKMNSDHDIAMLIAKACGSFEEEIFRLQCKAVVTNSDILPKLLKLVGTRLPTESVAYSVGGCKRQELVSKPNCHSCEEVTSSFQKHIAKALSKDVYLQMFKSTCDKLGASASKLCMIMAGKKYVAFRNEIINASPSRACAGNSLCLKENVFTKNLDDTCSICKDVVQYLRGVDRSPEVQTVVQHLMKSACASLGEFKELCDKLADDGLVYIFELIATELEPTVVCEELHLCESRSKNVISAPLLMRKEPTENTKKESSLVCSICQVLINEIEKVITGRSSAEEIEQILKEFCGELPSSLGKECSTFIDQFGSVIVQLIVSSMPPKRICEFIQICPTRVLMDTTMEKLGTKSNELCILCEFVMTKLDSILKENSTVGEIESALNYVCGILPSTIRTNCTDFVKMYTPFIVQILAQEIQPKQVCTLLGLCNSTSSQKKVFMDTAKGKLGMKSNELCILCEFVMTKLDSMLKENSTVGEIESALNYVCGILPSTIRTNCTDFVKMYTPFIVQLLAQEIQPKQVCTLLGLCSSTSSQKKVFMDTAKGKLGTKSNELCILCEFVMTKLDSILKENSTVGEIESALNYVCGILPSTIRTNCTDFVKMYTPFIVQLLAQEIQPKQVCTLLGLCSSTSSQKKVFMDTAKGKIGMKSNELCILCEFVMTKLDSMLKENSTVGEIESALNYVCGILPSTIRTNCTDFVKMYTPFIVQILAQEIQPKQVCTLLGLCNSTSSQKKVNYNGHVGKQKSEICALCITAMQYVDKLLQDNSTEPEITAFLTKFCNILPDAEKQMCIQFMPSLVDFVVEMISEKKSPKEVCKAIKLCAKDAVNSKARTGLKSRVDSSTSVTCEACQYIFNYLETELRKNASKEEVIAILDKVCDILPEQIKAQCLPFVEKYASYVVDLIVKGLPPKEFCSKLGICSSTIISGYKSSDASSAGVTCEVCLLVVTYIETVIEKNATKEQVINALDKVCNILPEQIKSQCLPFVKVYAPYVVDLLVHGFPPKEICSKLQICNSTIRTDLKSMVASSAGLSCEACQYVMSYLESELEKNASKEEVIVILDKVCDILPEQIKAQCLPFVEKYASYVVDLIVKGLSPKEICSKLGLCNSTRVDLKSRVASSAGLSCEACQYVMSYLETELEKNASKEEVIVILDKVCDILPEQIKAQCLPFVEKYASYVVDLIVKGLSPKEICSKLGLCNSTRVDLKSRVASSAGLSCEACQYVMSYLETELEKNASKEEVIAILDKVCDILPEQIKAQCLPFVEKYASYVVDLIVKGLSPKEICSKLGLCNSMRADLKSSVASSAGLSCEACQYVMSYLETELEKNASKEEVIAILDKVCDILPEQIKAQCLPFVEKYASYVVDLIVKGLSPKEICSKLGLCNNTMGARKKHVGHRLGESQLCALCNYVFDYLDNVLEKNLTKEQIEFELERVCNVVPEFLKQECIQLIETYTPMIIQLLLQRMQPKQLCTSLGLCNNIQEKVEVTEGSETAPGQLCVICEFVMQYMENALKKNATQQEIEQALKQVCGYLPETVRGECSSLVDQYFPALLQLLLQFSPEQVCTELNLCTSQKKVEVTEDSETAPGQFCVICEFVMQYMENALRKNATQQEIEQALKQVCGYLPETVRGECSSLIDQYFPALLQLLLQFEFLPQEVCTKLNLCTSQKKVEVTEGSETAPGQFCVICEFVMQYMENALKKNSTEQEIEQALKQVCGYLPETVRGECSSLVDQYFPALLQLLLQFTPEQVCTKLNLCTSQKKVEVTEGSETAPGQFCVICEFVMQYMENALKKNSTEQEIEQALKQVCGYLPETVRGECSSLVDQYFPALLQLLLQFTPEQVCTKLNLCTSQKKVEVTEGSKTAPGQFCVICEFVMQYMENALKKNSTEQEIEQALKQVCGYLPETVRGECSSLVDQYFPALLQLLLQFTPQEVCTKLNLCTSQKKVEVTESSKTAPGQFCVICEFVMQYMENALKKNSTEQEIEQALKQVCGYLPETVRGECSSLVDQYFPALLQLLLQFTPQEVCTKLNLCTSQKKVEVTEDSKTAPGQFCVICEFAMQYMENALKKNSTEQEIEQALKQVCGYLPETVRGECSSLVDQYFPALLQLLLQFTPQEVCTKLNLCTSQKKVEVTESSKTAPGQFCVICEFVMQYMENALKKNSTEQEIEQALKQVCGYLPETVRGECSTLVDQYFPALLQLLLQFTPQEVCTKLNLCTSQKKVEVTESSKTAPGQFCVICEFVMQYMENALKKNSTEQEIEQALKQVCGYLPETVRGECSSLVDQYFPALLQLLLQFTPQEVCTKLNLCTSQKKVEVTESSKTAPGQFCVICEFVMQYMENALKKNSTEQEIEQALKQVCGYLPETVRGECSSLVDQYFPALLQLLLQFTPQEVCTKLNLCTSQKKVEATEDSKTAPGQFCVICEFVMQYMENALKKNSTEQEIEQALKQVCGYLPETVRGECSSLVDQYFPTLLQLLLQFTPQEVCTKLNLCTSQKKVEVTEGSKTAPGQFCVICEFVMQYMENALKKNSTEQEIEQALKQVCGYLPETVRGECSSLVDQYFPALLQLLLQFTPQEVCTKLNLCTSQKKVEVTEGSKTAPGQFCVICEFVMQYMENALKKNSTEQEIEQALKQVCGYLPRTVRGECSSLVDQYFPTLLQLLLQFTPQKVCTKLNLCTSQKKVEVTEGSKTAPGQFCVICEFVMQYMENALKKNSTEQEIEQALKQVCGYLPETVRGECSSLVDQYFPALLQLLLQFTPQKVCTKLNLCTSQKKVEVTESSKTAPGQFCVICEFVMQYMENALKKNSTEQEIEQMLEKVCTALPSSVTADCDALVQQYLPLLVKMLFQKLSPNEICTTLHLCKSQESTKHVKILKATSESTCEICQLVVTFLGEELKANATQQDIEQALEKICGGIPSSFKNECLSLIKQYFPLIVQLLELNPHELCATLKLCPEQEMVQTKVSGVECIICEFVMNKLEGLITANSTVSEIEAALDKVCSLLPSTIEKDCDQFVAKYGQLVLKLLMQQLRPRQVCIELGLCSSQTKQGVKSSITEDAMNNFLTSQVTCEVCNLVMTELEKFITSKSSEEEIAAALEKVCLIVKGDLQTECENFVKLYTPYVLQILTLEVSPKEFCKLMKLCSNSTRKVEPKPVSLTGPSCLLCEVVIDKLKTKIESNSSEAEIKSALDKICDYVPSIFKEECEDFIQQYTAKIVKLILDDVPSEEICSKLGLCSSDKAYLMKESTEGCTLCKFLLEELRGLIKAPISEVEAKKGLEFICTKLPTKVQTWCKDLVIILTPNLVEFIGNKIDPIAMCQLVKLCSPPLPAKKRLSNPLLFVPEKEIVPTPAPKYNVSCTTCKFAWYEIQTALATPYWEVETKKILLHLCQHVTTWPEVCQYLVNKDLPGLFQNIRGFRFPIVFCQELNLCPPAGQVPANLAITDGVECKVCKILADIADFALKTKTSAAEAETVLTKVCNTVVPESEKSQCIAIVDEYSSILMKLVAQYMNPKRVCQAVELCPKLSQKDAFSVLHH